MNKTNFKLFTMFLAGIAFSALTVFAATISISTNFEDGAIQYLKKLVILMDNNNTWITLDWDTLTWKNIYGDNINWNTITGSSIYGEEGMFEKYCNYGWTGCVSYEELTQWWWESLWNTWSNNKIYYSTGNVGIGTNNPNQKLVVNGTGLFSGLKVNSIAQFDNGIFSSNISGNTITTTNFYNTLNFKASGFVFKALNDPLWEIHINSSWYLWIWELNNWPLEKLHVNGKVQIWTVPNLKLYSVFYPVIESSTGRIAFKTKSGESNNSALNIYDSWVTIWNTNTLPSEKLVVNVWNNKEVKIWYDYSENAPRISSNEKLIINAQALSLNWSSFYKEMMWGWTPVRVWINWLPSDPAPWQTLTVSGNFSVWSNDNKITIDSNTQFWNIVSTNWLKFSTSWNVNAITINNSGYVGIGKINPRQALDLSGAIKIWNTTTNSGCNANNAGTIEYRENDTFNGSYLRVCMFTDKNNNTKTYNRVNVLSLSWWQIVPIALIH